MCSMSEKNDYAPDVTKLEVIGADANNLRDIDCAFPLRGLSAVVGVSGSGKSSLLQNTIAAEAARRNILFHGASKREGGDQLVRAFIGPAPAALFVGQRPFQASVRTTVGTATGLLADLRHLFLAEGEPVTEEGDAVPPPSPATFADWLTRYYRGRAIVWAIPLRWAKSDGVRAAACLVEAGIKRGVLRSETDSPKVHETGREIDLTRWRPLSPAHTHALEAEVGTIRVAGPADRQDVEDLLDTAWRISGPDIMVEVVDATKDLAEGAMGHNLDGARHHVHPAYKALFRAPDRHLLTFNAPEHADTGACPTCKGLGRRTDLSLDAFVTAPEKSLHEGAFALWTPKNYKHLNIQHETIEGLRGHADFAPDRPWQDLPETAQTLILDGSGDTPIQGVDPRTGKKQGAPRTFAGFRNAILSRVGTPSGAAKFGAFISEGPCPTCAGTRWSREARALHAAGRSLPDWLSLGMTELAPACRRATERAHTAAGHRALQRLAVRAEMLTSLGLGHLSADRGMQTVSDGESRRLQIGATLAVSVDDLMLLLDEPARGLHETDLGPMIAVLQDLAERHCVLLNEHRGQVVQAADHVLTLGPGPGPEGGHVVADGPAPAMPHDPPSRGLPAPPRGWIAVRGACMHNVQDQDVRLPLGAISSIVGVSGSGKSSFARGVLIPALLKGRAMSGEAPDAEDLLAGRWSSIEGIDGIRRVHVLHQRVPPRNRRSLVATMTGALDAIAKRFAATDEARRANLKAEDFRLNSGSGRCPTCLGSGTDQQDEEAPCPTCGGRRYQNAALAAQVAGLTIAETLDRPVSRLASEWSARGAEDLAAEHGPLFATMGDLGLGHVALGRRVDSLSGGEVQRLRVAQTLAGGDRTDGHLFFLDEPAAGLHRDDARRLMEVLRRMVDEGRNTVIIIEHNMHIVRAVDWLVEFGPGAGPAGGKVVAAGTPSDLAHGSTPTAQALSHDGDQSARSRANFGELSDADATDGLDRIVSGDLDQPTEKPAANTRDRLLSDRRLWEVGDLNLEVGKLLLDAWDRRVREESRALLDRWQQMPGRKLVINPALAEMRVWGATLPRSVAKSLLDRLPQMGLVLRNGEGVDDVSRHPAKLRAALSPPGSSEGGQATSLAHAIAIGGGFVELEDVDGRALAAVEMAPMDLKAGLIGPQVLSLGHLSRLRPEGACPACAGTGAVTATDPGLLLASRLPSSGQDPEAVLTPQAAAILKGVWRAEARPFFRRLEEEGLADPDRLAQDLLHGFWRRPGHGTFLKSTKDKPDEVASWLRWDGLFSRLWGELSRSKDKAWAKAVVDARHTAPCPLCAGSGHGIAARLLRLEGKSLADWATSGTLVELRNALAALPTDSKREAATRQRLIKCLHGTGKLSAPAEGHQALSDTVRRAFVVGSR